MQDVYPYLVDKIVHVKALIMQEEQLFGKTLKDGEKKLNDLMDEAIDNKISGADAFKLYDTYGFPFELTLEILQEKGYTTDRSEFDEYMSKQKELSKSNTHHENAMNTQNELLLKFLDKSEFIYDKYHMKANIIALISDDKLVDRINKEGYIILDKTCFYATGGGQVNDTGMISSDTFKARVIDVFKAPNGQNVHKIKVLTGVVKAGEVELVIDEERRKKIESNHSSVHLLQYSLRTLIDSTIAQNGSRVDDLTLRFDFTSPTKLTDDMLISIEDKVNRLIKEKIKRVTTLKNINEIDKSEVMALFNEKYGDVVRLVEFNGSKELCGGTHVKNTGDIKSFSILSFESKGSNVYRIEAATGVNVASELLKYSKNYLDDILKLTIKAKSILQEASNEHIKLDYKIRNISNNVTSYKDLVRLKNELAILTEEVRNLEKDYTKIKEEKLVKSLSNLKDDVITINNTNLLLKKIDNMNINSLKQVMDNLVNEYQNIFILLANVSEDSINFLARSNNPKLNAGVILKDACTKASGNGGGSPTFAQGAGHDISKIEEIFDSIKKDLNNE
jgi:alanyl-tRNA synthetase